VLPDEITLMRGFWLMMHADSRDLARIRAVVERTEPSATVAAGRAA
jgi:hypothetical protein